MIYTAKMTTKRQYLKDYEAPEYQIKHAHFYFNLHETKTHVTSSIEFFKTKESSSDLKLLGEQMQLLEIQLNDHVLDPSQYIVSEKNLTVLNVPTAFTLKIKVQINPQENKSCEGLYLSQGVFCTQCEAESFRKITYFLDRPDVLTKYTVEIEADKSKYPLLLSNGDCVEKKEMNEGRHYAKWIDPFKKPSYLFALVAGDLGVVEDTFITQSGRPIKLEVFAPHGKQKRSLHAMNSLKQAMKWDEDTFGLEYDLNQYMIVSIDDFNMGAMENKGLNVFNSKLVLADIETATDDDFHSIQSVVGHEYFHNWSGNRVTCRNWFELSLKEGLTVFRDQEFSADMTSASVQRIKDVESLRSRQFSEDASPNAHPVRPESCLAVDNFYTATIYEKGAEVIRMLQTIVGKDGFKKGLAHYFKKYDGCAVTIDDFCLAISEANNNIDLKQFKLWYSQAGTPQVTVNENYNADLKEYRLSLTQSCPLTVQEKELSGFTKKPFYIPLKFGLILENGFAVPLEQDLLILDQTEKTWTFKNISSRPVLSLNRSFSAPIKIKHELTSSDSLKLIESDTDHFLRREAAFKMYSDELKRLTQASVQKQDLVPDPAVVKVFGTILKDENLDSHSKSFMLTLPSYDLISQELETIYPQHLFAAKKSFLLNIVKNFKDELMDIYQKHQKLDSIGDRALKNLILQYLNWSQDEKYLKLAHTQYIESDNMTDQITALYILNNSDTKLGYEAIEDFYSKWADDSVVFIKWLQIVATSTLNINTFKNVLKASQRKAFDSKNPNNLYSLQRTFGNNIIQFHNETEAQDIYNWYSDEIIRVDQINPQVAARLAQAFALTPKMEPKLKDKAQIVIRKILNFNKISGNTREILEKYLV